MPLEGLENFRDMDLISEVSCWTEDTLASRDDWEASKAVIRDPKFHAIDEEALARESVCVSKEETEAWMEWTDVMRVVMSKDLRFQPNNLSLFMNNLNHFQLAGPFFLSYFP